MAGTRHVKIAADGYGNEIRLLYPVPREDNPWGVFDCLRGTYWGDRIRVVSGEIYTHALYGLTKPLREKLGRPPRFDAKRIPEQDAYCAKLQDGSCAMAGTRCRPGTGELPMCYWSPETEPSIAEAASAIGLAWDAGRYVIVIEGDAFIAGL